MAATGRSTVVGVFADRQQAERAMEELVRAGFTDDQVGYLGPGDTQFEGNTGVGDRDTEVEQHATAGAAVGGVVGGLIGAAAALLIPGIGPAVAGGVLAAVLTGAGVGLATGGIVGALTGMDVPEEEARRYERDVQAGRTIVTVKAGARNDEAESILRRHGA
jgi:hypothetical protein